MKKEQQYWCNCNGIVKTYTRTSRPKCETCGEKMTPVEIPKIGTFRTMVEHHSAQEINGFVVDVQTANAICTVYDDLSEPKNREKLLAVPIDELGVKIWKFFK